MAALRARLNPILTWLKKNWRIYSQVIFGILLIVLALYFLKGERQELHGIKDVVKQGQPFWSVIAILLTAVYVVLQGAMYYYSFIAVGQRVSLVACIVLFLKRNFISVFLPAGGVTSLAFFTQSIENEGVKKTHIQAASTIYGVIGIVSVVIVAIPIGLMSLSEGYFGSHEWCSLVAILLVLGLIYWAYKVVTSEGRIHDWLIRKFPSFENFLATINSKNIGKKGFLFTVICSVLIEVVGISQLYMSFLALHLPPSWYLASLAYIVSVILLIISPFLRGMGAIEVSMVYLLQKYGYAPAAALSATLLYRFLEFWLPLLLGICSFLLKVNKLLLRILPALFLFILGIIDIASVLTPPLVNRLNLVHEVFSLKTIMVSNYFVLLAGVFLITTAIFMLKGVRSAFFVAIALCAISIIGNLLKSFDYEEALISLIVLVFLIFSGDEYKVRPNLRISVRNFQLIGISLLIVIVYGIFGVYFLDHKYWHLQLSFGNVVGYVFKNILLLRVHPIWMANRFTRIFFYSLNIWGMLFFCFVIYLIIKPKYKTFNANDSDLSLAKDMLYRMGYSANDFFKIYYDKHIFFPENIDGFVSYKVYKNYAVVLEEPVVKNENDYRAAVEAFESYCSQNRLKTFYYRVPESQLLVYQSLGKKKVLIGQEAILSLDRFSLTGKSKKSLRNAINHATASGLHFQVYAPPIKDGLLQRLEAVSDEWLSINDREEIVFSQGIFSWDQLKNETILTIENEEGMVDAFMNILPDFGRKTITYDLLRYRTNAVNGTVDFLLVEFFQYMKERGYETVNLGFAPLSGFQDAQPQSFLERSIKFTSSKVKPIAEYQKGLRKSKEKFDPDWFNKYLIYDQDYDMLHFPVVFNRMTNNL